ncbi:MAG TPA: hemerythrin domain-containing protein [Rhodocyclaceae bacterium]|nr:hemerythrin domain-containing protein [Rhodocyclaceae bacterium]
MKRNDSLLKLSREHHGALVLAKRAQGFGPTRSDAADAFMAQLVATFAGELEPHFQDEENTLLPALQAAGENALVERTLAEHAELRGLIDAIAQRDLAALPRFGSALAAHVRFEERELFPAAENILPPETLSAIEAKLHHPHPNLHYQGA